MTTPRPPRLRRVTLRAGTRYRVVEDASTSEYRVLERDAEVEVRLLAMHSGQQGMYVMGDVLLVVEHDDEVRGPRLDG